eukprot:superscaffoldBa00006205_g21259
MLPKAAELANPNSRAPVIASNALTELQATLEKAMQEMSQLSNVLKELQEDVSSMKTSQAKVSMDIAAIFERLELADGRIMDRESENDRSSTENEPQLVDQSLAPIPDEDRPPRPMRFQMFLERERGALVSALADDTVHLWNLRQKRPAILHSLKFSRERYISYPESKWLYIGTERGNIHIVNVESFMLSGYVIMWNKAIELEREKRRREAGGGTGVCRDQCMVHTDVSSRRQGCREEKARASLPLLPGIEGYVSDSNSRSFFFSCDLPWCFSAAHIISLWQGRSSKAHPGPVVHISDNPMDEGK